MAWRAGQCHGLPESNPPNTNGWDPKCANAKSGIWCMAKCQDGFTGAFVSGCRNSVWQPPSGSCLLKASAAATSQVSAASGVSAASAPICSESSSSCYPDPNKCRGFPPGANPPDPNSTVWQTNNVFNEIDHGTMVSALCQNSLVGSVISYCIRGVFTKPVGGCTLDPRKCYSPPAKPSGWRIQDWPIRPFWNDGDVITTTCINDFTNLVRKLYSNNAGVIIHMYSQVEPVQNSATNKTTT